MLAPIVRLTMLSPWLASPLAAFAFGMIGAAPHLSRWLKLPWPPQFWPCCCGGCPEDYCPDPTHNLGVCAVCECGIRAYKINSGSITYDGDNIGGERYIAYSEADSTATKCVWKSATITKAGHTYVYWLELVAPLAARLYLYVDGDPMTGTQIAEYRPTTDFKCCCQVKFTKFSTDGGVSNAPDTICLKVPPATVNTADCSTLLGCSLVASGWKFTIPALTGAGTPHRCSCWGGTWILYKLGNCCEWQAGANCDEVADPDCRDSFWHGHGCNWWRIFIGGNDTDVCIASEETELTDTGKIYLVAGRPVWNYCAVYSIPISSFDCVGSNVLTLEAANGDIETGLGCGYECSTWPETITIEPIGAVLIDGDGNELKIPSRPECSVGCTACLSDSCSFRVTGDPEMGPATYVFEAESQCSTSGCGCVGQHASHIVYDPTTDTEYNATDGSWDIDDILTLDCAPTE
jgi:hypothetical protein